MDLHNPYVLRDAAKIKRYCMVGHAVVTLYSPTGVYYSYSVEKPHKIDKDEFESSVRFIYFQDHKNGNWIYIGELLNNGKIFRRTRASRVPVDSLPYKGALFLVKMMNMNFATPMILKHDGFCSVCGKALSDEKAMESGMHRHCYNMMKHGS